MQRYLRTYIYSVITVSIGCLVYFLFNQAFCLSPVTLLFVAITICAEYCGTEINKNVIISLTSSSYVFLTLCFGVYPAMISNLLAIILLFAVKYKTRHKVLDLIDKNEPNVVRHKHKDIGIKFIFNISSQIITISAIYFSSEFLYISFNKQADMWKVGLIAVVGYIVQLILMSFVVWFNSGVPTKQFSPNDKTRMYIFYDIILSILLTYSYKNIGLAGALLCYSLLFPLQQTTSLYLKAKSMEEELFIDELTQAYNMRFFEDMLASKIANKQQFSLMMIDLDKFKAINDTYGHLAGNKVLEELSKTIRQKIVGSNYLCRYGGDEFVIIADNPQEVKYLTDQLFKILNKYVVEYKGHKIDVLFSIGIYEHLSSNKEGILSIIEKVDKAMYSAKQHGGGIAVHYNDTFQAITR